MLHGDVLGERTRISPDNTAAVCVASQIRLSYRQLNERAIRCAQLWREHWGLSKRDRVGILSNNRIEFLDCFFASGKTGIVLVPLNTRLTPAELAGIIKDSGLKLLLYDGDFADKIRQLKLEHSLSHWVAFDNQLEATDISYAASLANVSSAKWTPTPCDPEDIYCLLYTSGTTGKPKGVMIPHRMIAWNGFNTALCWGLREDDVSPIFTPLYHAGGLSAFLVPILAAGGTIILHRHFDASEVWTNVEREKCTVMLGVPTIYKMLAESPEFQRADLSHVRWFISGGAPLPVELIETYKARGVTLKQGYGLTEVGVNCFSMSCDDALRKAGSIGRPMMFTHAKLANSDTDPSGQVGELWLKGPHVSKGYWNDPAATASSFDHAGWFHTGDIARCDADGFFYIVGRSKDMFISGGVNVYPAEVEAALLKHPQISDAAVIGIPDPTWGEVGIAYLVSKRSVTPPASELTAYLESRLAKFKIPKQFIFVQELPRTAYGKVAKSELRKF